MTIGKRIRALRRARKLTQKQLADQAGLYHTTISEIERGITEPDLGTLRSIAEVFGITVSRLLDE